MTTNQGFKSIIFAASASNHFYFHVFHRLKSEMERLASGTTFLEISAKDFGGIAMPTPPLDEQRRIAEVLDTVDDVIQKTEQLIAKLKQMKQGLLHDLLTRGVDDNGELRDPERHPEQFKDSPLGRIPKAWEARRLRDVAAIIDPNPSHRYPQELDVGVPIASTENFVDDDGFWLEKAKRVSPETFQAQASRCAFSTDSIVFARKGRLGFARPYGAEAKVFSHTVVIINGRPASMNQRFLLWALRSEQFFDGIRLRMNTNLGVPTLGVGFLGGVEVVVPSLAEQTKSAATLDAMATRVEAENRVLAKLRLQKNGIMDDLLTGRVRTTVLEAAA